VTPLLNILGINYEHVRREDGNDLRLVDSKASESLGRIVDSRWRAEKKDRTRKKKKEASCFCREQPTVFTWSRLET
jgi:hypothetical protein